MTLLRDPEMTHYRTSIRKQELKEAEFVLEEGPFQEQGNGALTGTVTVTYRPTGKSKQYATGRDSKWPYVFEIDLSRGAFF